MKSCVKNREMKCS